MKTKKMKTITRLMVLILVLIFILSSCTSSETEVVPEYNAKIVGERDLQGYTVKWGFSKSENNEENVFGFLPETAFADLALDRKNDIETKNNCVIDMTYSSVSTNANKIQTAMMSGEPVFDIATNTSFTLYNYIRAGYFHGLSNLIDVKNEEKYGNKDMLLSLMWNDDLYGVVPFAWPELMYTTFGCPIVVNENLIIKYGLEDPREYVEKKEWTWDKFEEALHNYTITDGERTIYGMSAHGPYFAMLMFLSNGVGMAEHVDGKVICGAYTDAGREALERARAIYVETCKDCFHPDSSPDGAVDAFLSGDTMLLTTHTSYASGIIGHEDSIMYKMENVGILPYPQGPNATPGEYSSYYESMYFTTTIPLTSRDAAIAAFIIEEMYEPLEGFETKDKIAEYMYDQMFFDKRDAEVYLNMMKNMESGFVKEGARKLIEESISSATTITALLDKYSNQYDTIAEEFMTNRYNARIAVFGE